MLTMLGSARRCCDGLTRRETLKAGALSLLGDADLRGRLARAGRRTVEADYSFAVRMDKLRRMYDRMLGRG